MAMGKQRRHAKQADREGQVRNQDATVDVAQVSEPDHTAPTALDAHIDSEQCPCA